MASVVVLRRRRPGGPGGVVIDVGTWMLVVNINADADEHAVHLNEAMALALGETAMRSAGGRCGRAQR